MKTTPSKEFKITMGDSSWPCPEHQLKDKTGKVVRVIKKISDLEKEPLVKEAGLCKGEIVEVVRPRSFEFLFVEMR